MAFGPIDITVLEFKYNEFNDQVIANLTSLVSNEIIRILDLIIVRKDEHSEVSVQELQDLDPATLHLLEPLRAEISGMITVEDIKVIGKKLKDKTTTAIMLIENLWTVNLKQDIVFSGGRLVIHERIPHDVVSEAIRDLAEYD